MPFLPSRLRRTARHGAPLCVVLALASLAACGGDGSSLLAPEHASRNVLPPPPHYPIIFMHGFNGNSTTWTTMVSRFKSDGYGDAELVNWSYDFNQSNATTAQKLSAKIDSVLAASGAHHVDIVTHSMGGLSARYYVRNLLLSADTRVDAVVALGVPDHGTSTAFGCQPVSCAEMRPYSSFLTKLNATDETWGTPRYATWWSACDEVIYPQKSVILTGATNTQTACLRHSQLHEDFVVYSQVRDLVRQTPYGL
jgi:triacylglycerol lipase